MIESDGRNIAAIGTRRSAAGQVEKIYKSEKDARDIFAMQDAIAGEFSDLLLGRFAIAPRSSTARRDTTNEEAYRLYLQGMYLVEKEDLHEAKRAVELRSGSLTRFELCQSLGRQGSRLHKKEKIGQSLPGLSAT